MAAAWTRQRASMSAARHSGSAEPQQQGRSRAFAAIVTTEPSGRVLHAAPGSGGKLVFHAFSVPIRVRLAIVGLRPGAGRRRVFELP